MDSVFGSGVRVGEVDVVWAGFDMQVEQKDAQPDGECAESDDEG